MKAWLAALVLVIGCRSTSKAEPAPTTSTTTAVTTIASAPARVDAAVKPAVLTPREVADRWNAAHVAHDAHALEGLYAGRVSFYGQDLTNKECVARKKAAFDKSPDYTQSLSDFKTFDFDAGAVPVTDIDFKKTTSAGGVTHDYKAALSIDRSGLIVRESDATTDRNLELAEMEAARWCIDFSEGMVEPTDKVKPPFKISALHAHMATYRTQYFQGLVASIPGSMLTIDDVTCPTKCEKAKRNCGYSLRVRDYSKIGQFPSILVTWIYVDAVDGVVIWDDNGVEKREPLPDD
jgi:hypothetical protein